MRKSIFLGLLIGTSWIPPGAGAELAVLTDATWDRLAPPGKEADCILGDFALKSDRLWVVVAQPLRTRNANMTVRQVGGAVIDLTLVDKPNDQLSAFYPGMRRQLFDKAEIVQPAGKKVVLVVTAAAQPAREEPKTEAQPEVRLEYELEDGQPFLLIRSTFKNTFEQPLDVALEDDLRADNFDRKVRSGITDLFWVHDHYFEQAYGLLAEGHRLTSRSDLRNSVIGYLPEKAKTATVRLDPGQSYTLVRRLIPGPHLLAVQGIADRLRNRPTAQVGWHLVDPVFKPVAGADLTLKQGDTVVGTARSDEWGWIKADLPLQKYTLTVKAIGQGSLGREIDLTGLKPGGVLNTEYELEKPTFVDAVITDDKGRPIPCKVAFKGTGKTSSPNWGPPSAPQAVVNLFYSENGRFTVPINPGTYEAIISYGPEHDVVRVPVEVAPASKTPLRARLRRAFETPGWASSDFHSHSSPSGDNTGDQRGRVLNLLCEQIDFAPCTEHNRLDSYMPHLKALGVEGLMGTCTGIELTGSPLPLNHQNSFPLTFRPRTQDGGGPVTDIDPQVQIRRLAGWDDDAEKLVQQNHPDIGWLFFDKDGDGKPDDGYKGGFAYMHVIEVHPISEILAMEPGSVRPGPGGKKYQTNNRIFNWLQLLNLGHRIPGVVNTDAHYNFHGSGGLRNYVQCAEEVPGKIEPLEIVRQSKKGHIVMSNGPFLSVRLGDAGPGDDIRLDRGRGALQIKVMCPNWFNIDRVQILVNGRPDPKLNFTRKANPEMFGNQAIRFDQAIDFTLDKDAHLIVVATGEGSELGEVLGPMWGRQGPTAVSNPIFADVDGGGFKANGDTLDAPLPVKSGQEVKP
jgi:hypothetical protein